MAGGKATHSIALSEQCKRTSCIPFFLFLFNVLSLPLSLSFSLSPFLENVKKASSNKHAYGKQTQLDEARKKHTVKNGEIEWRMKRAQKERNKRCARAREEKKGKPKRNPRSVFTTPTRALAEGTTGQSDRQTTIPPFSLKGSRQKFDKEFIHFFLFLGSIVVFARFSFSILFIKKSSEY